LQHDVAKLFFGQVAAQAQQARLLSSEYFSVDGTLSVAPAGGAIAVLSDIAWATGHRFDSRSSSPTRGPQPSLARRAMKAGWLFILGATCGAQQGRVGVAVESGSRGTRETPQSSFIPARVPFASISPPPAAQPPLTWLAPETHVLLAGQTPVVHVYAETGGGRSRKTGDFQLRGLGATLVATKCDRSREPTASRGFATLDFACQSPHPPSRRIQKRRARCWRRIRH
jgi:hypothetical protein